MDHFGMKSWRDGGKYPKVTYKSLASMIDFGNSWSNSDISMIWNIIVDVSEASSKFCDKEGVLPPYYSFCEAMNQVEEFLIQENKTVSWYSLPFLAIDIATPKNWELV